MHISRRFLYNLFASTLISFVLTSAAMLLSFEYEALGAGLIAWAILWPGIFAFLILEIINPQKPLRRHVVFGCYWLGWLGFFACLHFLASKKDEPDIVVEISVVAMLFLAIAGACCYITLIILPLFLHRFCGKQ